MFAARLEFPAEVGTVIFGVNFPKMKHNPIIVLENKPIQLGAFQRVRTISVEQSALRRVASYPTALPSDWE